MGQGRHSWRYIVVPFYCLVLVGCFNPRAQQWKGISPYPTQLASAILSHNPRRVKELLDSGANPNQISSVGPDSHGVPINVNTPLAIAVSVRKIYDTVVLRLLLDHGADPNGWNSLLAKRSNQYFTPLVTAIGIGLTNAVEYLLRHGANPNVIDPPNDWAGASPLGWAISDKRGLIRFAFLDRWAWGDTSLAYRRRIYDTIIATLFKYGASPTLADHRGFTPLHQAAWSCDSSVAEELIARGASLTAKDKDGETPEDIARKEGCTSVLNVLLRHREQPHK